MALPRKGETLYCFKDSVDIHPSRAMKVFFNGSVIQVWAQSSYQEIGEKHESLTYLVRWE